MNTYEYILKKYKINPGKQYFVEIPNMGRNNMAELFAEVGFTKGAEVGVDNGTYSEILCKANPNLHLFSIDPYQRSSYASDVTPAGAGILDDQKGFDLNYEKAVERLRPYNDTIVRKESLVAAKDFADDYFDFVYIDANHDYVNITNDIDAWKKKVRPGGILAGHDYESYPYSKKNHVKPVVDTYMWCYRMFPYFIVGLDAYEEGIIRDRPRSWFWVKPI